MADNDESSKSSKTTTGGKETKRSDRLKLKSAIGSKNTSDSVNDDNTTTLQNVLSKLIRRDKDVANPENQKVDDPNKDDMDKGCPAEKDKDVANLENQKVDDPNKDDMDKDCPTEKDVANPENPKVDDQNKVDMDKGCLGEKDDMDIDQILKNVCGNIVEQTHQEDFSFEKGDNDGDQGVSVEYQRNPDSTNPEGLKTRITKRAIRKRKGIEKEKDSKKKKKVVVSKSPNTRSVVRKLTISEAEASEKEQVKEKKRKITIKGKGKEKVEKNEGISTIPTEEIKEIEKEVKKKGKEKGKKKVSDVVQYPTLKIRTSPKSLYLAMQSLSDEQKDWVRSIGFESILQMKIDIIPSKMAFYIVNNLDLNNMKLNVAGGSIKIIPSMVHDVFGLPIGGIDLFKLPLDDEQDITAEWLKQYGGKTLVRPMQILEMMKKSKVNDFNFQMNFITLFMSTMVDCSKMGCCNISFLKYLRKDTDLKSIDWCKVMVDFLKTSLFGVNRATELTYYSGPITFLTLLYVDYVACPTLPVQRQRPSIGSWNSDLLSRRETAETDLGCFGLGKIVGQLTQDDIVEGYKITLDEKLVWLMAEKVSIEKILQDCRSKYPSVDFFDEFQKKFDDLFGKNRIDRKDEDGEEKMEGNEEKNDDDEENIDVDDENEDDDNEKNDGDGDKKDGDKEDKDGDDGKKDGSEGKKVSDVEESNGNDEKKKKDDNTSQEKQDGKNNDANSESNVGDKEKDRDLDHAEHNNEDLMMKTYNEEMFDDVPLSQIWSSPSFHKLCDRTAERHTRITADGAPSYSLGYSPLGKGKSTNEEPEVQKPVKRPLNLGPHLRSPYIKRVVEISALQEKQEKMVNNMILAGLGRSNDVVFKRNEFKAYRASMEMLVSGYGLQDNVMDAWIHVLNDEEKYKSNEAPRRLFLATAVMMGVTNGKIDMDKRYNLFKSNLIANLSAENLEFKHHDLLFFTMHRGFNYYLVVFNLKNATVVIIDNDVSDKDLPNRYLNVPNVLHQIMTRYLKEVHHSSWEGISSAKIEEIELHCCTTYAKQTESGVFTMRHMETYKGGPANKWKCGLYKESSRKQPMQLHNLRMKYNVKILLSEINEVHKQVVDESMKFDEEDDEQKMIKYDTSTRSRAARMKNFRLFAI